MNAKTYSFDLKKGDLLIPPRIQNLPIFFFVQNTSTIENKTSCKRFKNVQLKMIRNFEKKFVFVH